jgi:signal transduction histidine kinase
VLAERKGLKIHASVGKVPLIHADETRIKEIITNLINNAIKFTEKGSIIVLAKKEKGSVQIKVNDTGIGIPKNKMQGLFTKFYQVDASLGRKYGGTGLGLSIVKQLVELHSGKITVSSTHGRGTEFTVTLPLNCKKGGKK